MLDPSVDADELGEWDKAELQWRKKNMSRPDNDVTGVTNDGNIIASPPPLTTPAISKEESSLEH
jgi:hypothetical protein